MSLCNVSKSSASLEAAKCLCTHTYTAAAAAYKCHYLQLSTVDADVSHACYTCAVIFLYERVIAGVRLILLIQDQRGSLFISNWHWRKINLSQLCGYLFVTYPHTVKPYSIILSIWFFPFFASLLPSCHSHTFSAISPSPNLSLSRLPSYLLILCL